jgi:hypothetical protein
LESPLKGKWEIKARVGNITSRVIGVSQGCTIFHGLSIDIVNFIVFLIKMPSFSQKFDGCGACEWAVVRITRDWGGEEKRYYDHPTKSTTLRRSPQLFSRGKKLKGSFERAEIFTIEIGWEK